MERLCPVCGGSMEGKRASAKTCSPACKKRVERNPALALAGAPEPDADTGTGTGTVDAARRELTAAGRLDTALGRAALILAGRLDRSERETGAALATLTKQFEATLAAATRGADKADSPLDEVRRKRLERLGA